MTTLDLVIIFGVLLGVVVVLVVGVLRAPVIRLSSKEKEKIKQNGLIHFTKTEYIDSIQKMDCAVLFPKWALSLSWAILCGFIYTKAKVVSV